MRLYAVVAAGGAIGSVGRFWLATLIARHAGTAFPWGTILINIAGSFAIGWLAGLSRGPLVAAFTMAGLCGGFTTFSAFSLQTLELLRAGRLAAAVANVLVSVALCVCATAAGLALSRDATPVL